MKKRYAGYRVVLEKRTNTQRQALQLEEELKQQYGGSIKIQPIALAQCPGHPKTGYTMDHAHARYDGEKFCNYCGGYL